MSSLVDSGFIIALLSGDDDDHRACATVFATERDKLLPVVTLPEIAYVMINQGKRETFIKFLKSIGQGSIPLVYPDSTDLSRAADVMHQYADANLDIVDCIIIAMAERLNIERILTIDHRDFRMVRPQHIPTFTILP